MSIKNLSSKQLLDFIKINVSSLNMSQLQVQRSCGKYIVSLCIKSELSDCVKYLNVESQLLSPGTAWSLYRNALDIFYDDLPF